MLNEKMELNLKRWFEKCIMPNNCLQYLRNCLLVDKLYALARNFPRRYVTVHGWPVEGEYGQDPYTQFNSYYYILTLSTCWVSTHGPSHSKSRAWRRRSQWWFETMENVRKICILTEERNFTTRKCKNSWRSTTSTLRIYFTSLFYSIMKASIVKRFNRTLKNDMWK